MLPIVCLIAGLSLSTHGSGELPIEGRSGTGESTAFATAPITIILTDDLGYELLDMCSTPNMDALTAGGLEFTRAWVCPICSPTRAALLTGLYPTRTGIGSLVSWGEWNTPTLGLEHTTFAELLTEPVHLFGKWHVSFRHSDPNTQGFDHYAGCMFNLTATGTGYYDWLQTVDGATSNQNSYVTTATTDFAMQSGADVRLIAYHAIHTPYENPPGGTAKGQKGKCIEMVEYLDAEIGRLLANYSGYVIMLADNGTAVRFGGGKGSLMENGINVPFVVNGPGIVPGQTNAMINIVDIYATLAEMRGLAHSSLDSISFLPVLQGQVGRRRYNYVEAFKPNADTSSRRWAIRNENYKLTNDYSFSSTTPGVALLRMPGEVFIPVSSYTQQDRQARAELVARLPF